MRIQTSFALIVLPLAGALTLTGCPDPESGTGSGGGWASESCYCDQNGCVDYDGNSCTPSGSSGTSGQSSGGTSGQSSGGTSGGASSSGWEGTSSGGSSGTSGVSSSSSGGSGGTSSGSSGTTSSGGSSGSSSGDIDAGPAPICTPATVATDCSANQICSGGFCRYQCTSDAECKLVDNRLSCEQGICGAF